MRRIRITRIKSFVGALIPYYCIFGMGKNHVDKEDTKFSIKNGETIEIEVGNQMFCVVVSAKTSTGSVVSAPFLFPDGEADIEVELITNYSWVKGSSYELRRLR